MLKEIEFLRRLSSEYDRLSHDTKEKIREWEKACDHHKNESLLNYVAENYYLCSECGASVKSGQDWT